MASLLSPSNIREHIETDLTDTALQRVIDGEEQAIVRRFGPHVTADETFQVSQWDISQGGSFPFGYPWGEVHPYGATIWVYPTRPVASVTSATETIGTVDTVLAANDYIIHNQKSIERLPSGTHPRMGWGHRVRIVYVPFDESALRIRVLIDLVRLSLAHTGMKSQHFGDFGGAQYDDYQAERNQIMNALARTVIV